MAREILTEEERIRRRNESKQRYAERKKAERERVKALLEQDTAAPNYKEMYEKATKELELLKNQNAEYKRVCESIAKKEEATKQNMRRLQTEANTKIQYMLDAIKHAYISMQFCANSPTTKEAE